MENDVNLVTILVIFFVVVGIGASVVYYFARYYFQTHENDTELAPNLQKPREVKESIEEVRESLKPVEVLTKPVEKIKEPPKKTLQEALQNTQKGLLGRIKTAFSSGQVTGNEDLEYLEEILYTSDLGPMTVQRLVEAVGENLPKEKKSNIEEVRMALKAEMNSIFTDLNEVGNKSVLQLLEGHTKPTVIMIVGVNGAGKTTTIGKLAYHFSKNNLKTMVIAGDTFRAAAREQLKVWTDRAEVEIFDPSNVTDPSAVAFDGCKSAISKSMDVVIMDTAGRLHTQENLMAELQKIKRVIQKVIPEAPQETIIVLDANSGQNALLQAKTFNDALGLSGAVLSKLDGTAKGGIALGLACELKLPIKLIGVGEGIEDLRPFNSKEFVDSIL